MTVELSTLADSPRLLIEADLEPVQGSRFQPTGFPDLGAATFKAVKAQANGQVVEVDSLVVESAQSMANRLEAVCWDEGSDDLAEPLKGLPYVRSTLPDGTVTNSILEAHRLNSPYIVNSKGFDAIKEEIGFVQNQPFNRRKLAKALFKYDPCSLIHGVFLEKVGGVVRLPRIVSGFIEAQNVKVASSGGVKFDRVQPASGESSEYGKAKDGYGNVPFHRDDYTGLIRVFFNIDLTLLRAYGLGDAANELLTLLALYKIRKFLNEGLRLRTACDLRVIGTIRVTQPEGYQIPSLKDLASALPGCISAASSQFAQPLVTDVKYTKNKKD